MVRRWPSISTLPGFVTCFVFLRLTTVAPPSVRIGLRADCLASLSAVLLCRLVEEWPLPQLISTCRNACRVFLYCRTSSFQRSAFRTGAPSRVCHLLVGHW